MVDRWSSPATATTGNTYAPTTSPSQSSTRTMCSQAPLRSSSTTVVIPLRFSATPMFHLIDTTRFALTSPHGRSRLTVGRCSGGVASGWERTPRITTLAGPVQQAASRPVLGLRQEVAVDGGEAMVGQRTGSGGEVKGVEWRHLRFKEGNHGPGGQCVGAQVGGQDRDAAWTR